MCMYTWSLFIHMNGYNMNVQYMHISYYTLTYTCVHVHIFKDAGSKQRTPPQFAMHYNKTTTFVYCTWIIFIYAYNGYMNIYAHIIPYMHRCCTCVHIHIFKMQVSIKVDLWSIIWIQIEQINECCIYWLQINTQYLFFLKFEILHPTCFWKMSLYSVMLMFVDVVLGKLDLNAFASRKRRFFVINVMLDATFCKRWYYLNSNNAG